MVSWMLLLSSICWLKADGQFGLSLCSSIPRDEVPQVQIQQSEVLSQCWNSSIQSLSGFWMHRRLVCHAEEEWLLAPFWGCIMLGLDLLNYAETGAFAIYLLDFLKCCLMCIPRTKLCPSCWVFSVLLSALLTLDWSSWGSSLAPGSFEDLEESVVASYLRWLVPS